MIITKLLFWGALILINAGVIVQLLAVKHIAFIIRKDLNPQYLIYPFLVFWLFVILIIEILWPIIQNNDVYNLIT